MGRGELGERKVEKGSGMEREGEEERDRWRILKEWGGRGRENEREEEERG